MQNEIRDREYARFRAATPGELSKVAVTIEQDPSNPVPVFISYGTIKTLYDDDVTIADTDVTVLSYTVTELKLGIQDINSSCSIEGKMTFLINGSPVATSRSAPGKPDLTIKYNPYIEVVSGDIIEVKFKARPLSAVTEVESYINAVEIN